MTGDPKTELELAAYRLRRGATLDDLVRLLEEELATLRRRGHVTDRRAPVVRAGNGELIVVLEWSSEHARDDAHADPEVTAVWDRKAQLARYIAAGDVAGSQALFARWTVIANL
jgi:hypothetical protein